MPETDTAGWNEPSVPTKYLDAEDTGRTENGQPVVREVVAVSGGTLSTVSGGTVEVSAGTVVVSGTVSVTETNPISGFSTEATLSTIDGKLPDESGTWAYDAGSSGTVTVASGQRIIGIAAHAPTGGGSVQINGGDQVPVPADAGLDWRPRANLQGPGTVIFTSTDSYVIERIS